MKRNLLLSALLLLLLSSAFPSARNFVMYVIDTEGGKALLLISPGGRTLLVDAGFPGFSDRDAIRIAEAAEDAGIKKLDYLVVTHYDLDHVNNVPATVARIPAVTFMDHGEPAVKDPQTTKAFAAYLEATAKAERIILKPGYRIPFDKVEILIVTSGGQAIRTPVKCAGSPNPYCAKSPAAPESENSENAQSVGMLYTFGRFRMLDLGDLTWNKEIDLMCPKNPIGTVDLFMVSHHGFDASNSPALIHAVHPKVAIMNNGPQKVGSPAVLKIIRSSPGLQAAYQLHWSENAPNENPKDEFIANLRDSPDGKWIKVTAEHNGRFSVTNARTGVTKNYQ
jgi:competence protein ComEC